MPSSVMTGVLTGIAGGAGKYQQIQDDQRKYNLDQGKAKAEEARKLNFMRQSKREDYKYSASGLLGERGEVVTRGELEAMPPEARGALKSPAEIKAEAESKAEVKREGIAEEKRRAKTSEFIDAQTKTKMTQGEYEDRVEAGEDPAKFAVSGYEQVIQKETRIGTARDVATEGREQKKSIAAFKKSIDKITATPIDETIDSPSKKATDILTALRAYDVDSPEYKAVASKPAVKDALAVPGNAATAQRIFNESTAWTRAGKIDDIREKLKGKVSAKKLEEVIDYAETQGYFNE